MRIEDILSGRGHVFETSKNDSVKHVGDRLKVNELAAVDLLKLQDVHLPDSC